MKLTVRILCQEFLVPPTVVHVQHTTDDTPLCSATDPTPLCSASDPKHLMFTKGILL